MNKIITIRTFTLLFLFIVLKANAQGSVSFATNQINNPNVLPPDVSSFQKVNFLPVSNYTGRADIEIPFHEIDLDGLKIPIGLSYNTGGVKPNDVASSVGLNWSLNAGGMISKTVNGVDDFSNEYMYFIDGEASTQYYYDCRIGFLSYLTKHVSDYGVSRHEGDDLPDLFTTSAPGLSFSFLHNRAKAQSDWEFAPFTVNEIHGPNQNGQNVNIVDQNPLDSAPFVLDDSNNYKIDETYSDITLGMFGSEASYSPSGGFYNRFWKDGSFNPNYSRYGINSISVKNDNGFQYIFDKIDTSQYLVNRDALANHPITMGGVTISANFSTNVNLVAYHLSKIIDTKTGRFVEFQYEAYSQSFSEIMDNNLSVTNYPYGYSQPKGVWQKYPKLNRIKKIIFAEGYIDFNYTLNRDDVPGEKALTEIVLFDNKNNQIKKALLNFEYFQSPVQESSPFSKRLKLKDVTLQGNSAVESQKYKLAYNTTPLPLRILAVTDFFGYHNGTGEYFQNYYDINTNNYYPGNVPSPIGYFHPNNGQNSFLPIQLNANALAISGNYSLQANSFYCKAGILERIDYPTGGFTTLDYELNTFQLNNTEVQGGGLRVKEQKISDGTNVRTLKFEYKKADNTSSGTVAAMSKFIDFDYNLNNNAPLQYPLPANITPTQFGNWFSLIKTNYSKGNIELTNGCYVGYSKVKVFEDNKGYTSYEYTNPGSHPNVVADVILLDVDPSAYRNTNNYKKIFYDNGKMDLILNNDVFRGKLLKESVFNAQSTLLKETSYTYTEKLFKNMLIIKTFDNITNNELWANIEYANSGAAMYSYQFINFKQRRYLLTNVTENEYLNGSLVTTNKILEYDPNYSLVKSETITDNLNTFKTEYYYPYDTAVQSDFGMSNLVQDNRIGEKILIYNFKNNEKLLEEKILYKNFSKILPKQIKKYKSGSLNNTDEIKSGEATARDEYGNICEITDVIGNKTSYIWGYNKTKIIAKLENASYANVVSYVTDLQNASNASGSEAQFDILLANLRTNFPNSFVTTFTYKPLIGVSSIINPKGDKITYEYDSFGRLKSVRDKDNNILSENEYHYKPQN